MEKKKPDLAILIGHALASKKGKALSDPEAEETDGCEEHVSEIASDMLAAIASKDSAELTELLLELIECAKTH